MSACSIVSNNAIETIYFDRINSIPSPILHNSELVIGWPRFLCLHCTNHYLQSLRIILLDLVMMYIEYQLLILV